MYAPRSVAQSSVNRCFAMTSQSATCLPLVRLEGGAYILSTFAGDYSRLARTGQTSACYARPSTPCQGDVAMRDLRNVKLAELIVKHSTQLQAGETMLIESFDLADGLVLDLVDAVHEVR